MSFESEPFNCQAISRVCPWVVVRDGDRLNRRNYWLRWPLCSQACGGQLTTAALGSDASRDGSNGHFELFGVVSKLTIW